MDDEARARLHRADRAVLYTVRPVEGKPGPPRGSGDTTGMRACGGPIERAALDAGRKADTPKGHSVRRPRRDPSFHRPRPLCFLRQGLACLRKRFQADGPAAAKEVKPTRGVKTAIVERRARAFEEYLSLHDPRRRRQSPGGFRSIDRSASASSPPMRASRKPSGITSSGLINREGPSLSPRAQTVGMGYEPTASWQSTRDRSFLVATFSTTFEGAEGRPRKRPRPNDHDGRRSSIEFQERRLGRQEKPGSRWPPKARMAGGRGRG